MLFPSKNPPTWSSGALELWSFWSFWSPGAHRHELDVKCWAMLFAHVAGFAAINCFGDLQQAEIDGLEVDGRIFVHQKKGDFMDISLIEQREKYAGYFQIDFHDE